MHSEVWILRTWKGTNTGSGDEGNPCQDELKWTPECFHNEEELIKKPTLGGCEMAQPSQRWSFLPGVPSCLLTSVSFVWVLLHQIPNEVFGCSKRKHRAQNHFAGWNVIIGYPCGLNMRRGQLFTFPLPCTQGHQCLDKSRGMAGTPRETQWTKRWQSQAGTLTFGSKFFFAS